MEAFQTHFMAPTMKPDLLTIQMINSDGVIKRVEEDGKLVYNPLFAACSSMFAHWKFIKLYILFENSNKNKFTIPTMANALYILKRPQLSNEENKETWRAKSADYDNIYDTIKIKVLVNLINEKKSKNIINILEWISWKFIYYFVAKMEADEAFMIIVYALKRS